MKRHNILVIDSNKHAAIIDKRLTNLGFSVRVTCVNVNLESSESDVVSANITLMKIFNRGGTFDAVLIGNNLGAGITSAELLLEDLRKKTIIAWNWRRPNEEAPYEALGYSHFVDRGKCVAAIMSNLLSEEFLELSNAS
jgi:hypothetical protein